VTTQQRKYQTQWIAQFFAAAELTRRGYLVSITLGNAKFTDLMVETPGNQHFSIDVKGQSTKSYWIIKPPENDRDDQYFILVYAPRDLTESPQYFILNSDDIIEELKQNQGRARQAEIDRGNPLSHNFGTGGMAWDQPLKYEDQWGKLPK
jgi:hypothetical protein